MIVVSDVNGTPRNPDPDPYNDDPADDLPDEPADDDFEDGPVGGQLWRAFTEWVDDYAWTIITLGMALILLDVLLVLVVLLWQVNR